MTIESPANPQHALDITDYPRRWFAAAVMMVAALMDMIDGTVVNVALPTIHRNLGATGTQLEWIVSAYMLAFAVMLITAGSLGDVFGRKRVFVSAIALFGLASLGAGLAQTPNQLIAARVIQGIAAAAMTPQVLATFRSIFRGKELGQAYAMFGMVLGFASAVGLVLGGLLTQADLFGWSWRTIFFVNLPVALVSLVASLFVVPETRDRSAGRPDVPGAVLLTAALVAVVYPLLEGRHLGWPLWTWLLLAAGLAGLGVLFVVEARRRASSVAPLLRPELFRVPAFTAGLTVQLLFSGGLQGFSLMFVLWLQIGQHFSPLHAGVTLVAFSVGSFIAAPFSISLAQRYGRLVLSAGGLLLAAGIIAVSLRAGAVGMDSNVWPVVPGLIAAGAGLAFLVIPLVNVVLAAAPIEAAGGASGIFGTAQQLGGAIGVAVMGTVFFGRLASHSYLGAFTWTIPLAVAAFVACALFSLALPGTAVPEDYVEALAAEPEARAG